MSYKRGHFDNLYLVVDQQNRWKSELLPSPASALLDPLLIGEKRERSRSSYFLINQFDLTKAKLRIISLTNLLLSRMDLLPAHQQPRSSATRLKSNEMT
jgi:hypothetical protein